MTSDNSKYRHLTAGEATILEIVDENPEMQGWAKCKLLFLQREVSKMSISHSGKRSEIPRSSNAKRARF